MPTLLISPLAKLVAVAVVALALLAAGAYGGYRWELGAYNGLKAQYAQTLVKAQQVASTKQATITASNDIKATADAVVQQKIVTHTITVTKEIPTYVHDTISCPGLTVGLARVLRASAAGVDPASLDLAPGQSDDACSDVTPSEVASWFAAYAGASVANAQQLNDLEAAVRANNATAMAPAQ